jgi:hypothetical protein
LLGLGLTVPEDELQKQFGLLKRALPGTLGKGFAATRVDRTGKRFPASSSAAPLRDDEGPLPGIMATIEDISERKRIERELHEKTVTPAAVTHALNCFLESGDWGAASKELLAHSLKSTRPDIRVIYISGYAQGLPEAQVPTGAVFLQKPFRLASLGEQLKLVPRKVYRSGSCGQPCFKFYAE